jgi:hypothetical protein
MKIWNKKIMETITLTKREYSELIETRRRLEKLLESKKRKISSKKDGFVEAFGILKGKIRGDSLGYISKLRKEWRK